MYQLYYTILYEYPTNIFRYLSHECIYFIKVFAPVFSDLSKLKLMNWSKTSSSSRQSSCNLESSWWQVALQKKISDLRQSEQSTGHPVFCGGGAQGIQWWRVAWTLIQRSKSWTYYVIMDSITKKSHNKTIEFLSTSTNPANTFQGI